MPSYEYVPTTGVCLTRVNGQLPRTEGAVRLVCISDTHLEETRLDLPEGDILIHAGDILLQSGGKSEADCVAAFGRFCNWLDGLAFKDMIVVCGNHDAGLLKLGRDYIVKRLPKRAVYLENETVSLRGLTFFGSPHSVGGSQNYAWQKRSAVGLWDAMPPTVDVVISHGPAYVKGQLDYVTEKEFMNKLISTKARLHVCGHLHWAYGLTHLPKGEDPASSDSIPCVCCSIMDGRYEPNNKPVVVDLPVRPLDPPMVPQKPVAALVHAGQSSYRALIEVCARSLWPAFTPRSETDLEKVAADVKNGHVRAVVCFGAKASKVLSRIKGEEGVLRAVFSRDFSDRLPGSHSLGFLEDGACIVAPADRHGEFDVSNYLRFAALDHASPAARPTLRSQSTILASSLV